MIAILYPQFYGIGGIARYLDSFLANLPENNDKVYLITGDEYCEDRVFSNVEIIHIAFSSNRFSMFFWMLKAREVLTDLFEKNKIRAINLHIPPLIPGLMLPKHIPLILTAHTTYIGMSGQFYQKSYFTSQWGWLEVRIKRMMEAIIFKRATKIITLTEQGRQEIATYGFNKPVVVIPNGVDTQLFKPNNTVNKIYDVLFCGRIELRKGSRGMVEVCKQLIHHKKDISILIVGYGDDYEWVCNALAEFKGNVELTGKVPFSEMQNYYHQSKLYVSTSYYEGLPGTCLEAMAMGLPAVVWDFLFYKDLVIDGTTGLIVEPNNYDLMASKIIRLLNDEEMLNQLKKNTRSNVVTSYQWAALSERVIGVMN
jgi:glycosyltransferase involved in cell wall biosynthesis